MKKTILVLALSVLALTACDKKDAETVSTAAPQVAETQPANPSGNAASTAEAVTPLAASEANASNEEKILNFYNWADYIPADMVSHFEKETGIKVNYQTFENNEGLHAKLVAGNSGFDLVVPGAVFAKSQIDGGLLLPLDKARIPNLSNLDPLIMEKLAAVDPGNDYLVPWAWSYTTVSINRNKVIKALGDTPLPDNVWELVFNPIYTEKLKSCGIVYLDSPTEIIPPAMHYLGKNAYSNDPADHQAAGEMLAKVRPHIRLFTSTMIDDLASGKACVALGYAGDMNIARMRALENKSTNEIEVLLPKTGGLIFIDSLAIPKDAKHPHNAALFINYFLRPEVSASLTNEMSYVTANKAALPHVKAEMVQNKSLFVDAENMAKMISPSSFSNEARASMSNVYILFKKGQ